MTTWDLFCALHLGELTVLGPKCHSTTCTEVATRRVRWVTGPLDTCAQCAERFRQVGSALGCPARIETVEYTPAGLDDGAQRMRLLELT